VYRRLTLLVRKSLVGSYRTECLGLCRDQLFQRDRSSSSSHLSLSTCQHHTQYTECLGWYQGRHYHARMSRRMSHAQSSTDRHCMQCTE
jgi:hypothetical protein